MPPQRIAGIIGQANTGLQGLTQGPPVPMQGPGGQPLPAQPWNVGPQTAENTVLQAIDELQADLDNALAGPMQNLNNATFNIFIQGDKIINKITKNVTKTADCCTADALNKLDLILTQITNVLNVMQFDQHFILTQLAAKAGWTQPGQDISFLMTQWQQVLNKIEFGSTLVLSVKEAMPFMADLIEVLREIRDRMNPQVFHVAGTPPARFEPPDEPDVDTGDVEEEMVDAPVDWSET